MDKIKILEYEAGDGVAFEFNDFDYIEDFDLFENIIIQKNIKLVERMDGPSSKISLFKKDGLLFKLIFNSDLGNSLMLIKQNKQDNDSLRALANEVYNIYVENYSVVSNSDANK